MATKKIESRKNRTVIIVARHAERLDYCKRNEGSNWVETADYPWDPPLTENGIHQGRCLGQYLKRHVWEKYHLPPMANRVYSSPLKRCRQTASAVVDTFADHDEERRAVCVLEGLVECISEAWYRSWSLPTSNSTWNYHEFNKHTRKPIWKKDVDTSTLHPAALAPIQDMVLESWKQDGNDDVLLRRCMDYNDLGHNKVVRPYCWDNWESRADMADRMEQVLNNVAQAHRGETVLMVSHGGLVAHLFSRLTGSSWKAHGHASYACFSVYESNNGNKKLKWKPLVVNESKHTSILVD